MKNATKIYTALCNLHKLFDEDRALGHGGRLGRLRDKVDAQRHVVPFFRLHET